LNIHDIDDSDGSATGMGLRDYARVARTYWRSIAAVTLVVTVQVMAWSVLQPRVYAAKASGVVLAVGTDNVSSPLAGDTLAKARAKNYKSLAGPERTERRPQQPHRGRSSLLSKERDRLTTI